MENVAKLLTLQFSRVFFNLFVFKNLILPAERRRFLKNKTKQQKTTKKVAKLLTYGGQVIDPTTYIYICCEVIIWATFWGF